MTTTFDFRPLYRNSLGFDQFAQLTEQLFANSTLENNTLENRIRRARHHSAKTRTACGSKSTTDTARTATKAATQPRDSRNLCDNTYPHYNIAQLGESDYQITLALAGFSLDEIDITVTANEMTVTGSKKSGTKEQVGSDTQQFLHQGINQSDFSRKFELADHVQVQSANMEQGLLSINLTREVPAALQPRKVAIGKTGK